MPILTIRVNPDVNEPGSFEEVQISFDVKEDLKLTAKECVNKYREAVLNVSNKGNFIDVHAIAQRALRFTTETSKDTPKQTPIPPSQNWIGYVDYLLAGFKELRLFGNDLYVHIRGGKFYLLGKLDSVEGLDFKTFNPANNYLTPHVPGFVSLDKEPEVVEFSSFEEFNNLDFFKHWKKIPGFHKFSISQRPSYQLLLAEMEDGEKWWVVGYLYSTKHLELPFWDGGKK